jgi:hypothetical protein
MIKPTCPSPLDALTNSSFEASRMSLHQKGFWKPKDLSPGADFETAMNLY